ncbi:MAG: alpha/beta fold hydrolase [Chloroflexi bacterium]|nr:alpha/beta fold hydrolase [Chloroflexota bacterium]MDA1145323.1 alpha/beta fold hydrolase [Chloroflexota bacterium]
MPPTTFRFTSAVDGFDLGAYRWPHEGARGLVVIAHGAAEHSLRYDRVATALNAAGYAVWSLDHRGHGHSPGPAGLGDHGDAGWDALVADVGQFVALARADANGKPVILFGHSMGSFAAQQLILDHSSAMDALILSGSGTREAPREGEPPPAFAPNAQFEPARTPYDWLSRDNAEVDKYIADPMCGFETQAVRPPRGGANPARLTDPIALAAIRSDLPILFVSGDRDPVGRNLEGLHLLERRYRDAGVTRIDTQYYADGRHEMLNEINRDEVTANLVGWLDTVTT